MRLILFCLIVGIVGCKKDKFTTAPQIKFVSISPDIWRSSYNLPSYKPYAPKIKLNITDAEGDLGLIPDEDTTWVYVRRLPTTRVDSVYFPALRSFAGKNFEADVEISLHNLFNASCSVPNGTDTLFYEVYIKDFGKNQSNVITTDQPLYFICN